MMKAETLIYDKIRKIIPDKSKKTVFFAGITATSQEVYFYAFIDGKAVQCYTLAEQYELDENELSEVFSGIAGIIKGSVHYIPDQYNVATIIVDKTGIKMDVKYYDMDESEYQIQKEWKKAYIRDEN
ncbi:immunity protein YezG family protein [Lachnospiraceae bacterium 29-84]